MQELERQRNAQLARQLDAFRKDAETQRALAEKNLQTLQQNYEANLAKANTERQQALAEAQKRETELRGQFTQKTQTLESAAAQAEQQLAAIAAQREKEDLVIGQLTGLYTNVRDNISDHEYDKAIAGLESLRDFVNRPDIATLPALAKRHDFDVFVIDSLTSYVQSQIDEAKIDTATLLQAANQFTILRQRVSEAQDLLKAGKTADAEKAYADALNLIPEVATSYAYFVGRDKEAEAARQARLAQALDRAEAAFAAGNFVAAAASYRTAFSLHARELRAPGQGHFHPGGGRARGRLEAGRSAPVPGRREPPAARRMPCEARAKYDDALAGYLNLLGRYPLADQTKDAITGIQATVRSISETAGITNKAQQTTLSGQIASLQQELTARRGDVASLQQRLKDMQDRFDALDKSYKDYVSREDPVLKTKGDSGLMDTKPYFDAFFRSTAVQGTFPGISDRVKRYDLGFQSAGRSDAIQDAITIVINYSRQRTPDLKRQFIQIRAQDLCEGPGHDPAAPGDGPEAHEVAGPGTGVRAGRASLLAEIRHGGCWNGIRVERHVVVRDRDGQGKEDVRRSAHVHFVAVLETVQWDRVDLRPAGVVEAQRSVLRRKKIS